MVCALRSRANLHWAVAAGAASGQTTQLSLALARLKGLRSWDPALDAAAAERLGLPESKVIINLEMYGNTTAGTIPLALADAVREAARPIAPPVEAPREAGREVARKGHLRMLTTD